MVEAMSFSALISAVYFFAVLAYCLLKKNDINAVRVVYINALLLYALLLISLNLLPIDINQQKGFNYIPFGKFLTGGDNVPVYWARAVYAVVIFLPLGFFSGMQCRLMAAKRPVLYALMAGLLVSLVIEVSQLYLPFNRICDVDDIFFNVSGSFIGAILFHMVSGTRKMTKILRRILYY
jgi:glycopeptide antibiotics resistance protein